MAKTKEWEIGHPTVCWVTIQVRKRYPSDPVIESMRWSGMMLDHRTRWDWLFKLRAAHLQIKYPRFKVEMTWGSESAVGKPLVYILKDKLQGKKRMVTLLNNAMNKRRDEWSSLFPIEDDPRYKPTMAKITRYEKELVYAQVEYDEALSQID